MSTRQETLRDMARARGLIRQSAGRTSPDRWVLFNIQSQRIEGFANLAAVLASLESTQ